MFFFAKKHIHGKLSTPNCTNSQFGSHKWLIYFAGPPLLFPLIHTFIPSIFSPYFGIQCCPHTLWHINLFQYPPLQIDPYPCHLLFFLLLLVSILCTFVLFCFCNQIRHCTHHHNPSCGPCLLHNLYWLLDLLTKLMLLLYLSVCDSTPFVFC